MDLISNNWGSQVLVLGRQVFIHICVGSIEIVYIWLVWSNARQFHLIARTKWSHVKSFFTVKLNRSKYLEDSTKIDLFHGANLRKLCASIDLFILLEHTTATLNFGNRAVILSLILMEFVETAPTQLSKPTVCQSSSVKRSFPLLLIFTLMPNATDWQYQLLRNRFWAKRLCLCFLHRKVEWKNWRRITCLSWASLY